LSVVPRHILLSFLSISRLQAT